MLLGEDTGNLQLFPDRPNHEVAMFEIRIVPPKCKILLHDRIGKNSKLVFG